MSYQHIENLYRCQTIQLFRECYALEKLHGSSSSVSFENGVIHLFSGGEKHDNFVKIFDQAALTAAFVGLGHLEKITVFGEVYGGGCQGMKETYGPSLKFAAFEVKIGETWLSVPNAEDVCKKLGIEFVFYEKISTDIEALNAARDSDSVQAVRNGCGPGKKREGIVCRPLVEFTASNGGRVICKHKRDDFSEVRTPRPVGDPGKLLVLEEANSIALEWVTGMRLNHVLDKIPGHSLEQAKLIIDSMVEDVFREGAGEVVDSREARQAIAKRTMVLYKKLLGTSVRY